ncbi:MAG: hypothetical protein EVG15_09010 [Candidatus Acididesulfobacter diazotrophicus]|jgi:hypothetical protein|uniref:Uncharacterized protein n=1 Tax=Candidatus Acididesulfobacter diazotrophicus TaxID=2597226 RepID=A0A519BKU4_9DELT|nr:MAG: hypothetical protein EVG15_09010 [Candidatus Acididesulfobacter diazotrophicus]
MKQVAIIIHQGTECQDSVPRVRHALIYAKEIKEAGNNVLLIFDGEGTKWLKIITDEPGQYKFLNDLLNEVKSLGIEYKACDFCSTRKEVKEDLSNKHIQFLNEYDGHPDIGKLINEGYQIIVI